MFQSMHYPPSLETLLTWLMQTLVTAKKSTKESLGNRNGYYDHQLDGGNESARQEDSGKKFFQPMHYFHPSISDGHLCLTTHTESSMQP